MARCVVMYVEHHSNRIKDHLASFDTANEVAAEVEKVKEYGWEITSIHKDGEAIDEVQLRRVLPSRIGLLLSGAWVTAWRRAGGAR